MNSELYDLAQKKLILILTSVDDYLSEGLEELRLFQLRLQNDSEGTTWVSESVWRLRKRTTETILLVS